MLAGSGGSATINVWWPAHWSASKLCCSDLWSAWTQQLTNTSCHCCWTRRRRCGEHSFRHARRPAACLSQHVCSSRPLLSLRQLQLPYSKGRYGHWSSGHVSPQPLQTAQNLSKQPTPRASVAPIKPRCYGTRPAPRTTACGAVYRCLPSPAGAGAPGGRHAAGAPHGAGVLLIADCHRPCHQGHLLRGCRRRPGAAFVLC